MHRDCRARAVTPPLPLPSLAAHHLPAPHPTPPASSVPPRGQVTRSAAARRGGQNAQQHRRDTANASRQRCPRSMSAQWTQFGKQVNQSIRDSAQNWVTFLVVQERHERCWSTRTQPLEGRSVRGWPPLWLPAGPVPRVKARSSGGGGGVAATRARWRRRRRQASQRGARHLHGGRGTPRARRQRGGPRRTRRRRAPWPAAAVAAAAAVDRQHPPPRRAASAVHPAGKGAAQQGMPRAEGCAWRRAAAGGAAGGGAPGAAPASRGVC